ncbi:MAG: methyl-accepting chemotaxis protein [Firmicutes bacterium]|nr:methyl-accepting chemotaxis protein [Bacillota bacterium]
MVSLPLGEGGTTHLCGVTDEGFLSPVAQTYTHESHIIHITMKIKNKFAVYNIMMLITPILLIGVISVCFLIIFILKFPVEELNIPRAALIDPEVFSEAVGEFFKGNPAALWYMLLWAAICALILVLSTTVMTRLMSKSIENPINELDRAADYIREGNLNFEVMGSNYDEIDKLCNNFDTMRRELKKRRKTSSA